MSSNETASKLFFEGDHQELVKRYFDSPSTLKKTGDFEFVIASLAFLGRLEEAEALTKKFSMHIGPAAYFAMAVNSARLNSPLRARFHLKRLKKLTSSIGPSENHWFYFRQAAAIIRFYSDQIRSARVLAKHAHAHALHAEFGYGRILAQDLLGHCEIKEGEISSGLTYLQRAAELAKRVGFTKISKSIETALIIRQSQYGYFAREAVSYLEQAIAASEVNDCYSVHNLRIELFSQLILRGKWQEAESLLENSLRLIYGSGNERQKSRLNRWYGHLLSLQGESERVQVLLESAGGFSDHECLLDIKPSIDDRLGELKRASRCGLSLNTKLKLFNNNCLMFAYEALLEARKVPKGRAFLLLDFLPDVMFYGSLQGLQFKACRAQSLASRFLRLLVCGFQSKSKIVAELWGYEYDPIRHDSLIYSCVQTCRRALSDIGADWIVARDSGYLLNSEVLVINPPCEAAAHLEMRERQAQGMASTAAAYGFNSRQTQLIESIQSIEAVCTQDYAMRFSVSEGTAHRDLRDLMQKGVLRRFGKGRSTSYSAAPSR